MRTFHSIYAVIIALGLKDVAEFYKPWGGWIWNNTHRIVYNSLSALTGLRLPETRELVDLYSILLVFLIGIDIINVAVRFLFVTEVLSKVLCELRAKYPLTSEQRSIVRSPDWRHWRSQNQGYEHPSMVVSSQWVTLYHYPAILGMGGMFYML